MNTREQFYYFLASLGAWASIVFLLLCVLFGAGMKYGP